MKTIVIDPVTRIEGHAKITIRLDDAGGVADTQFHVTQFRGFEKFTEGRPFYEMPAITSRICGICPISHSLASVKACDAIMSVKAPPAAAKLRELLHMGQITQSHALSFFLLSGPDFLLGYESDIATRNMVGLITKYPNIAKDGIALRKFGQQVIEVLAGERIHPSWAVPGGVNAPLKAAARDQILEGLPEAKRIARSAVALFKRVVGDFTDEMTGFGSMPTMYAGLVDRAGNEQLYDGDLRFVDADGEIVVERMPGLEYRDYIGEATVPYSFLKAPYFKPIGYPAGAYRVGPLARLNAATRCGTEEADAELAEFRERFGRAPKSTFLYHYARSIELIYALERMEALLNDPLILDRHVRAQAGVNDLEGVGMIEAPRGVLIHHYKVNEDGVIVYANLIVATGHNNIAISRNVEECARHYITGPELTDGMLNRVQAVLRAYDPCLSCSTHANGQYALDVELLAADGSVLDSART